MNKNKKQNLKDYKNSDEKSHNLSSFDKEKEKDLTNVAKKRNIVYYTLMAIFLILAIIGITALILKNCSNK